MRFLRHQRNRKCKRIPKKNKMIHLAEATIDEQDMDALADWIKTYPRLTKGKLTLEYEEQWSSGWELSIQPL